MNGSTTRYGIIAYGLCAIGLGSGGIATGDFSFAWPGAPGWVLPAFGGGFALVACGLLALTSAPSLWVLRVSAAVYALWAVTLHAPRVAFFPGSGIAWWALAEVAALAVAGLALARRMDGAGRDPPALPVPAVAAFPAMVASSAALHMLALAADPHALRLWPALLIPLALAGSVRLPAGSTPAAAPDARVTRNSHAH